MTSCNGGERQARESAARLRAVIDAAEVLSGEDSERGRRARYWLNRLVFDDLMLSGSSAFDVSVRRCGEGRQKTRSSGAAALRSDAEYDGWARDA